MRSGRILTRPPAIYGVMSSRLPHRYYARWRIAVGLGYHQIIRNSSCFKDLFLAKSCRASWRRSTLTDAARSTSYAGPRKHADQRFRWHQALIPPS